MKMSIGQFLFTRLREIGINHVFGVPGDFNLQLLEQIKDVKGIIKGVKSALDSCESIRLYR